MVTKNRVEKNSEYWTSEVEVARSHKSDNTDIVVSCCTINDSKFINIREWKYKNNEWLPTKKGYAINIDNASDILESINIALDEFSEKESN